MKKNLLLTLISIFFMLNLNAQSTCASPVSLASGACLTNQNFPGTVNMAGLCVGGNNPALYVSFIAGTCSEFTITSNSNVSTIGSQILTSGCGSIAGLLECHDNVVAGVPFTVSGINSTGSNLLTPGTSYVMRLWGPMGGSVVNICYDDGATEAASNECTGALGLGNSPTTFYNGGDCAFTGSYTDPGAVDPTASALCAGSLENTQWVTFQPIAGVPSFQIIGSNINCTGGGCGFQFGIFSGSCGALTAEGCYGNKVCTGGQSVQGPTNVSSVDGFSLAWSGTSSTGFTVTVTKTGGGNFTGTEVFYLVMDGNGDADCQYTLTGINVMALPIELIEFSGKHGYPNVIKWVTASEMNNDYFTLERSTDGISWETVNTQKGAGNSSAVNYYTFSDYNRKEKLNYYRLSQTDFNGYTESFKIIAIDNRSNKMARKLVSITNLLGVLVPAETRGLLIYRYDDGTSEKIFRSE